MDLRQIEEQFIIVRDELATRGEAWAEKKAAYEELDDLSKDKLSIIKIIFSGTEDLSEVKLERLARADIEWSKFQTELSNARKEYLIADAKYTSAKSWHETLRSLNAVARQIVI